MINILLDRKTTLKSPKIQVVWIADAVLGFTVHFSVCSLAVSVKQMWFQYWNAKKTSITKPVGQSLTCALKQRETQGRESIWVNTEGYNFKAVLYAVQRKYSRGEGRIHSKNPTVLGDGFILNWTELKLDWQSVKPMVERGMSQKVNDWIKPKALCKLLAASLFDSCAVKTQNLRNQKPGTQLFFLLQRFL